MDGYVHAVHFMHTDRHVNISHDPEVKSLCRVHGHTPRVRLVVTVNFGRVIPVHRKPGRLYRDFILQSLLFCGAGQARKESCLRSVLS
jgi:hypothetical protein